MTRLSSSTKFEILFKFVGIFGGVDVTQHQHIIYRYHTSNIENVEEYMTTESESSTELAETANIEINLERVIWWNNNTEPGPSQFPTPETLKRAAR